SSRRRHTRSKRDWSSDVCSSDLFRSPAEQYTGGHRSRQGCRATPPSRPDSTENPLKRLAVARRRLWQHSTGARTPHVVKSRVLWRVCVFSFLGCRRSVGFGPVV